MSISVPSQLPKRIYLTNRDLLVSQPKPPNFEMRRRRIYEAVNNKTIPCPTIPGAVLNEDNIIDHTPKGLYRFENPT